MKKETWKFSQDGMAMFGTGMIIGIIILGSLFWLVGSLSGARQEKIQLDIFNETCQNKTMIYSNNNCQQVTCECAKNTTTPCLAYCEECKYEYKTYNICDKGNKVECKCLETYCPAGSIWYSGSKLCYDSSKSYGIVDGIGCRVYSCNGFIYELNKELEGGK